MKIPDVQFDADILNRPLNNLASDKMLRKVLEHDLPCVIDTLLADETLRSFSLRRLSQVKPEAIPPEKLPILASSLKFIERMMSGQIDAMPENFFGDKKEGDAPVIVCLGDSITFGAGVADTRKTDAWTYQWNRMLNGAFQVLNFGFSGTTLQREGDLPYRSQNLLQRARDMEPVAVVIMFGTNDSKEQNWEKNRFEREYRELVEEVTNWPSVRQVCLLVPPSAYQADGCNGIVAGIRDDVIREDIRPFILGYLDHEKTIVVDLYELTKGHPEYFTDGVHPNAEGNRVIAEKMLSSFMIRSTADFREKWI